MRGRSRHMLHVPYSSQWVYHVTWRRLDFPRAVLASVVPRQYLGTWVPPTSEMLNKKEECRNDAMRVRPELLLVACPTRTRRWLRVLLVLVAVSPASCCLLFATPLLPPTIGTLMLTMNRKRLADGRVRLLQPVILAPVCPSSSLIRQDCHSTEDFH